MIAIWTWVKGNMLLMKVGIAIAALLAVYLNGYATGAKSVEKKWTVAKAADEKAQKESLKKALYDMALEYEKRLIADRNLIQGYQNDLKVSRADIARERAINDAFRLRFRAPGQVPGPASGGQAAGPGGADAAPAEYIELPAPIAGGLRDLAQAADVEVDTCVVRLTRLQQWVRENGFYGTIQAPTNTQE